MHEFWVYDRKAAIDQALRLRREIEEFEARWPAPNAPDQPMPQFSWRQLERQLADLAGSPMKASMAGDLVSATRKLARFKPPEMVLREVLCLSGVLLDESFRPGEAGLAEAP